ncbi:unnamed protein product [Albugo candida]|uniref:Uncharacterized protein n=1 Tax=Albugo candida TaxID=65357 RepID=A0A024GQ29_9STRA|nr:unnamed protein product [Albugo candida]|eukprot:CCI48894.1 unnamed protein product [Albugo candida]
MQIRSLKLKVYREWIHVTARHLTHAEAHETFVASDKCLSFFMGRFEIMLRRMTNMTTLSDNELVLRAINYNFYLFTHRPTLHPSRTIFMDDTAVFFEDPRLKMSTLLEPDMSGSSQQASEFDSENEIENGVEDTEIVISNIKRAVLLVLASKNRPMRYVGNSLRTRRTKNAMLKKAALGSKPLASYLQPKATVVEVAAEDEIDAESEADVEAHSDENGDKLRELTQQKGKMENYAARARAPAILAYFRLIKCGRKRLAASSLIADVAGKRVYYAKLIRTWDFTSLKNGSLTELRQEKHAKRKRFLHDEDCILPLQQYLRDNKFKAELATLYEHTNTKILVGLGCDPLSTISERAVMRWLNALNIKYREVQKGIYVDEHKREDVLRYSH